MVAFRYFSIDWFPHMQQAYYARPIAEFLTEQLETVLGHLSRHHGHDIDPLQRNAWVDQISLLQKALEGRPTGWLALEFSIPRMGKRVDTIIIVDGIIFVVEFKMGANEYSASAIDQVVDYALDLKNFHAGSHVRKLVPIVVATKAPGEPITLEWDADGIAKPLLCNAESFASAIGRVIAVIPQQPPLDAAQWATSGYKPTPTIIEAAQALYCGHKVEEITRSDAGAKNLSHTTEAIAKIIENTKVRREKAICFVTGVPGAGKTLAGLNLVTQRTKAHEDEHAVFLSGNGPLVDVLREALARDEQAQSKLTDAPIKKTDAARKVKSFIQNIHHFRDENLRAAGPPIEHVAVFDEAQRAWDKTHAANFMARRKGVADFDMSEPEYLISVMDRHLDWCTIVCLVGGGQEINAGEAGLTEWFAALKARFPGWKVYTSSQLAHRDYHWGQDLAGMLAGIQVETMPELHLAVSVRSFRAETLSDFVSAVVAGEVAAAKILYQAIRASYPIVFTRDLDVARDWLRHKARGSERFGLVASSGASRLKPQGLNVHEKIDAPTWFLNDKADVRSSYYLEDVATEFDVQGLELDWVGVCWDADFRWNGDAWQHFKFQGTRWQNVNSESRRIYLSNAYRVLLTRARQGMVIYIPPGDISDPTRPPEFYEDIAQFFERCGVAPI